MSDAPSQPTNPNTVTSDDLLRGWKEIAVFCHSSERTVQRWERVYGLPVRRIGTSPRSGVMADRRELRAWLDTTVRDLDEGADEVDATPGPRFWQSRPLITAVAALGALLVIGGLVLVGVRYWRPGGSGSASSTASSTSSGAPAGTAGKTQVVPVRITSENGKTVMVGVIIGGMATHRPAGHPAYVLTAESLPEVTRVHVSRVPTESGPDQFRPIELAVVDLPVGRRVAVDRVPGIAAMEIIRMSDLKKRAGSTTQ